MINFMYWLDWGDEMFAQTLVYVLLERYFSGVINIYNQSTLSKEHDPP